jgi:hypothetical protein
VKLITNAALALAASLFLAGCQTTGVPIVVGLDAPAIPVAAPITTHPFQWKVYNIADLQKLLVELQKHPKTDYAIFALTPDGYKAVSLNMLEMERYIKEQRQIIAYLTKTLEGRAPEIKKRDK